MNRFLLTVSIGVLASTTHVSAKTPDVFGCVAANPSISAANPQLRALAPIDLTADQLDLSKQGTSFLQGNVHAVRLDQSLDADSLYFNHDLQTAQADGDVLFLDPAMKINAETAYLNYPEGQASLQSTQFEFRQQAGRGSATSLDLQDSNLASFNHVSYTTCQADEVAWQIESKTLVIDQAKGLGVARNAKIRLFNLPILWVPWLSFPINDQRKSGLLIPKIAQTDNNGLELSQPFYWNIAPNYDLTLSPGYLSKRGAQLKGEFRYLQRINAGKLTFEYLPNDDQVNDNRYWLKYKHITRFSPHWSANINLNRVSDAQYFEDFGNSLNNAANRFLLSRASINRRGELWNFSIDADDFQVVDDEVSKNSEPYQRLPRVRFDGRLPENQLGIDLKLTSEWVRFERNLGITGSRLNLKPSLSMAFQGPAWYVEPKLSYQQIAYQLDNSDEFPASQDVGAPIISLNTGLLFERSVRFKSSGYTQTLEPRLYFLKVPFENQSDLPDFDTSDLDFTLGQLFRDNRFSGGDRIGDAEQASIALSTRLFSDDNNRELFSATVGQIHYFADRKVQLGNPAKDVDKRSAIITELNWSPLKNLITSLGWHWNEVKNDTERSVLRFQYRWKEEGLVNVSYRYRKQRVEQADASLVYPISDRWNGILRWNYSLRDNRTLETLAGIEYESCCWALRIVAQQYVHDSSDNLRNSLFFQFEFKGLGSIGERAARTLERGILGYGR